MGDTELSELWVKLHQASVGFIRCIHEASQAHKLLLASNVWTGIKV